MTFYNPNIPRISDPFSLWQINFQKNFKALSDVFKVNHIALENSSNVGNHTFINLFEQDSPLQTNSGDFAIYTKEDPTQTDQIFMRYEQNGQEFQFSNYQIYSIPDTKTQKTYFTFLPGRILVYFGEFTPSKPSSTIDLLLNPPVSKNIMSIILTPITSNAPLNYTENKKGQYIISLTLKNAPFGSSSVSIVKHYYTVLANI